MGETTEEYRISVPSRKVRDTREALAGLGIEMVPEVPREELMAVRETDHGNLYATAAQIPGMLAQVSRHLVENGLTPGLRSDHEGWTPGESLEFLEMCLSEFEWEEGKIAHAEFRDPEEWENVRAARAELPIQTQVAL